MDNVFIKDKQQKMGEQAEYYPCNADGMEGIEFAHACGVMLTM